jgi:hypothetical protein
MIYSENIVEFAIVKVKYAVRRDVKLCGKFEHGDNVKLGDMFERGENAKLGGKFERGEKYKTRCNYKKLIGGNKSPYIYLHTCIYIDIHIIKFCQKRYS